MQLKTKRDKFYIFKKQGYIFQGFKGNTTYKRIDSGEELSSES